MSTSTMSTTKIGVTRRASLLGLVSVTATPVFAAPRRQMTMHRDGGCGCCLKWAALADKAGFVVRTIDEASMPALKQRLGVPAALWSCHTTVIGQHRIEGHVPFEAIKEMLAMGSQAPFGLAVPGMPIGSPGMETPDARRDAFSVLAFNRNGQVWTFA